jgi:CRP/FNR family transcriptional regulator, cyclic AMP receptor protein
MHTYDVMGYVASGLVLGAFGMQDMVKLRVVAMCSNVAFLIYALALGLLPVLALHAILLPLNGWRLAQILGLNRTALAAMVKLYLATKAERRRDSSACPPKVA